MKKAVIVRDKKLVRSYGSPGAAIRAMLRNPVAQTEVWDSCGEHLLAWLEQDMTAWRSRKGRQQGRFFIKQCISRHDGDVA